MKTIAKISQHFMSGVGGRGTRPASGAAGAAPMRAALVGARSGRPDMRGQSPPGGRMLRRRRRWLDVVRNSRGIAALELAVVAPVLLLILFGIIYVAILFNNYLILNNAVGQAARELAFCNGLCGTTPFGNAKSILTSAATPILTAANISMSASIGSSGCTDISSTTCASLLASNVGGTVTVTATYPCTMSFMAHNFIPGCTLTAQTSEIIQQ